MNDIPLIPSKTFLPIVVKILVIEDKENTAKVVARRTRERFGSQVEVLVAEDASSAANILSKNLNTRIILVDAELPLNAGEPAVLKHTIDLLKRFKPQCPLAYWVAWSLRLNEWLYPEYCNEVINFKDIMDIEMVLAKIAELIKKIEENPGGPIFSSGPTTPTLLN